MPFRSTILAALFLALVAAPDLHSAADVRTLFVAIGQKDIATVKQIVQDQPGMIVARSQGGMTPFHLAASRGQTEILGIFVQAKVDVDVRDLSGATPIMRAAEGGYFESVKLLNESFADLKAADDKGMTVLHHAAVRGNLEIIEYLMLRGAEINQRNRNGKTPMSMAILKNNTEASDLIERYGGIE